MNEGITWDKSHNFWKATVPVNGGTRFLGYFETKERAKAVRNRVLTLFNERSNVTLG